MFVDPRGWAGGGSWALVPLGGANRPTVRAGAGRFKALQRHCHCRPRAAPPAVTAMQGPEAPPCSLRAVRARSLLLGTCVPSNARADDTGCCSQLALREPQAPTWIPGSSCPPPSPTHGLWELSIWQAALFRSAASVQREGRGGQQLTLLSGAPAAGTLPAGGPPAPPWAAGFASLRHSIVVWEPQAFTAGGHKGLRGPEERVSGVSGHGRPSRESRGAPRPTLGTTHQVVRGFYSPLFQAGRREKEDVQPLCRLPPCGGFQFH